MPAELLPYEQNGTQLQSPTMPTQGSSSGSHNKTGGEKRAGDMAGRREEDKSVPQEPKRFIKRYRTEVAASASSVLSTLTAFPLDSVKTRMQTYKYSGFVSCVKHTYQTEHLRGFFRGGFLAPYGRPARLFLISVPCPC